LECLGYNWAWVSFRNQANILYFPGWDWKRDDQAVCLNELKLGFIGQSCLAPGFSTLVSNLVIISNPNLMEGMIFFSGNIWEACSAG
jgi:potassium large conductance calcium-activated channel subfamily M alpha protein 1